MPENRRGGVIFFKVDSVLREAKGNFTYNIGAPKRDALINADLSIAGYKEMGQIPFIEGEITDASDLVLSDFLNIENATLTLELANGKVFTIRNAWYAGEGNVQTEEGNIQIRFEGIEAEETNAGTTGLEGSSPPGIDELVDSLDPFGVGAEIGAIP